MPPAVATAPQTAFRELALEQLRESTTNPRRRFTALDELAASIRVHGILEPLLVRPVNGHHEIVAGARRYRAAQLAGLAQVPCLVRELDDHAAMEASIVENLQRADVHPLDEADGYAALMQADGAYTVDAIAAKVGKSPSYVRNRLKLGTLSPDVRTAFEDDRITAGHALLIARVPADRQAEALGECFYDLYGNEGTPSAENLAPVSQLREWIERELPIDLAAPETRELFPEVAAAVEQAETRGATVLALSRSSQVPKAKKGEAAAPLQNYRWTEASGKQKCAHAQTGVVVHGGTPEVLQVCATKGCSKHWPEPEASGSTSSKSSAPAYDFQAEHEKRERARLRWERLQPIAFAAIAEKLTTAKLTDDLVRSAFDTIAQWSGKELTEALGAGAVTAKNVGQSLAFALTCADVRNLDQFRNVAKVHKIDVAALLKQVDEPTGKASAKKAPAKKAGKKR